jgi:hypothetical protein
MTTNSTVVFNSSNSALSNLSYTTTSLTQPATLTLNGSKPVISTDKNEINLDELAEFMKIMRERLLIIVPNFEKHEKYSALKKAYENYKLIESMISEDSNGRR